MAAVPAEEPILETPAAAPRAGKGKLIAILAVVMSVEAAALYFALPRPTAAHTEEEEGEHGHAAVEGEMSEVSLGAFRCTNSMATRGVTHHISFELSATVAQGQAGEMHEMVAESHKARIRQAVVQVVRSSSLDDLKDPEFTVLKRQIKEEVNKTLQKSFVQEIIVSDFDLWDQ